MKIHPVICVLSGVLSLSFFIGNSVSYAAQTSDDYLKCIEQASSGATAFEILVDAAKACQDVEDLNCVKLASAGATAPQFTIAAAKACQTVYIGNSGGPLRKIPDVACIKKITNNGTIVADFATRAAAVCKRTVY